MKFGSVCSGIEAASVAWHPLGWEAAWLAEIEPFPTAVLAHHYPDVPNLGDMTKIARSVLTGDVEAPDVLVGGTPCQAFSVAGLREGLADERGQLTIKYVELADAIDFVRGRRGQQPSIIVWENVPGVLSSKDNAFGCLLGALAGEDDELQPAGEKWSNAGCVFGPKRTVAWRVLDAQYFGVAQRRRRVFLVASARKDFDPCKVLFEFDGVRRDTAPSREAWQEPAGTLASCTGAGGFQGTDEACSGYVQPVGISSGTDPHTMATLCATDAAKWGSNQWVKEGKAVLQPVFCTHGTQDPDTNVELAHTLGRNHGQENAIAYGIRTAAFGEYANDKTASTMKALDYKDATDLAVQCVTGHITHTLKAEGFDASEDGTGRGQPIVPVGIFQDSEFGVRQCGMAGTLRAGRIPEHQMVMQPHSMAVRRLTPVECERLQGFPDGYTRIPSWDGWRKMDEGETPEQLAAEGLELKLNKKTGKWRVKDVDGPRYKALGNSMAVPCMAFIGRRIALATGFIANNDNAPATSAVA